MLGLYQLIDIINSITIPQRTDMKKYIFTLLLASGLVACGGSGSSSTPVVKKTFKLDTRTFDYIATKNDNSWEQLAESKTYILETDDNIIELAWLCIEHDESPSTYELNHYVIDLSSSQANETLDFQLSCISPKNTSTVNISNGTADFEITDAEADNIRHYSSNGSTDIYSFIVPSHRTLFDLIGIGKNKTTNKYFGHRNNNLTLRDGETYSIDFNDTSSAELIEFTPQKAEGFSYGLNFVTESGIYADFPKENGTWYILPEKLKDSQQKENYRESWAINSNNIYVSFDRVSKIPGTKNRLTLEMAKMPAALTNWSIDKIALNFKIPTAPALFDEFKYQNIGIRISSEDQKSEYSFSHIGLKITSKSIDFDLLDFNLLPNFKNLVPNFTITNADSAFGSIVQYEAIDGIDSDGTEFVFYDFEAEIN
jgi:hypothetical protein